MSSSDEPEPSARRTLDRFVWATGIALLVLLGVGWARFAVVIYGEPIGETRLVVKPSPGKILVKLDFPPGTTLDQIAALRTDEHYFLDFLYVVRHTLLAFGDRPGRMDEVVLRAYGGEKPAGK